MSGNKNRRVVPEEKDATYRSSYLLEETAGGYHDEATASDAVHWV